MYLNMGKKRPSMRGGAKVTGKRSDPQKYIVGKVGLLEETTRSASPYSFYYPEPVLDNMASIIAAGDPTKNPEFQSRMESRQKKKDYIRDHEILLERFKSNNLVTVHKAFSQNMGDDGTLTRSQFTIALLSIGISDRAVIDRSFDLFDSHKEGIVDYLEVIAAIEVIVNGTNKLKTMRDCFALFDPSECGYIIQPSLHDIKTMRAESDGINHMMVKSLLEIFDQLQKDEEERLKKEYLKKNKKSKKNPSAIELPKYSKKIHLSFDEFCGFVSTQPLLVQAFMTQILLTMEHVYNRNRKVLSKKEDLSATLTIPASP